MSDYFNISGDKDDIFSCIDFYQKLTYVGSSSFDELRKQHLDMYLDDYKSSYSSTKSNNVASGKSKEYVSTGVILEDLVIEANSYNSDIKEVEYVSTGVLLDEDTIDNDRYILDTDVEYISSGVILEDLVLPNLSKGIEEVESEDFSSLFEDDEEEDFSSLFVEEDEDSSEDFSSLFEDDEEEDFSSLFVEEDVSEDFSSLFEEAKDDLDNYSSSVEDEGVVKPDNTHINDFNDKSVKEVLDSSVYRGGSRQTNNKEGSECDLKNISDSKKIQNIEDTKTCTKVSSSTSRLSTSKKASDTVAINSKPVVYKSVRDFVKQNPGCSVSDARKHFSSKEIQKALIGSKIAEKKNKLYVV